MSGSERERRRRSLAESIYPIPRPLDTFEQLLQWNHLDLADLALAELRQHVLSIRLRIAADPNPDPSDAAWLADRYEAVQREARGRAR